MHQPRATRSMLTPALFGALLGFSTLACGNGTDAPVQDPASVSDDAQPVFPASNRPDVRGANGAVSSGHPLATAVGHQVLVQGGNAVDAVVAMAGVLAVVRPHMNGVGGDAFGLIYDAESGRVYGLNGSGRAGALGTPDFFADSGSIPETGAAAVTVPGAVAAWADALDRFGTWTLARALAPAAGYARDGFPVSNRLRSDFESQSGALVGAGRELYLPGGSPPPAGALLENPALASTLTTIGERGARAFYEGAVAETLADFVQASGGHLTAADFAAHASEWVTPLEGRYRGHRIQVMPPNTQGFAQLQILAMAEAFDLEAMGINSPDYLHTLVEIKKLAFADRNRWAADPVMADLPMGDLLDPSYLRSRAELVDASRAADAVVAGVAGSGAPVAGVAGSGAPVAGAGSAGLDDSGDTVYLTAVDRWGNAVSWIQSLFHGFGSGLLEPETGVLLHNRGALFTLEEGHPNRIRPGKRPYHTLTPLLALDEDGEVAFTLGTPGGDGQTQTLVQIINNLLLFDMSPQEALEAPRFRSYPGLGLALEDRIPGNVRRGLSERGHEVDVVSGWTATFGGAQMIWVDRAHGTLAAAAGPRREAYAIAY